MSVYKRGDVWFYDFTVNGKRYRYSTGARSKEAALKIERRERDAAAVGSVSQRTLKEVAELWFEARVAGRKSAVTTAHRLKILMRHIDGGLRVSDIGPSHVTDAINSRRLEPVTRNRVQTKALPSAATANRDIIDTTLRPILRYAREALEQPVRHIEWKRLRLQEPRERVTLFTDDQITAREAKLPHWHRPIGRFIRRYGVRLREAFFTLDAVHDDGINLDIYTRERKNGPHIVSLTPSDAAEMRARIGRARAAGIDTPWFREMPDGTLQPIHWRAYQSAAASANRRAGIKARPAHDDRHHAGTTLLRKSGNLAAVKALLGHEDVKSTLRYAHTSQDDLRRTLRHAYDTAEDETPESDDAATA